MSVGNGHLSALLPVDVDIHSLFSMSFTSQHYLLTLLAACRYYLHELFDISFAYMSYFVQVDGHDAREYGEPVDA
jgi:hypothetical protein